MGKYGYLTTEKAFRNFDLRFKFRGEAKGNSGVFFHAMITGNTPATGPDIQGMQVEIDPNMGMHTGGLYESGGQSWVKMPTAERGKGAKGGGVERTGSFRPRESHCHTAQRNDDCGFH